jgi:tRNA-dihydrouridine synthase
VNGDIGSLADARRALAESGAAAVMIGRAAMGRPWLVGEVSAALRGEVRPAPVARAMGDAACRHYRSLLSAMGRDTGLRHARKHVAAYLDEAARLGSAEALRLRPLLCESTDPDAVEAGLAAAFAEIDVRAAA